MTENPKKRSGGRKSDDGGGNMWRMHKARMVSQEILDSAVFRELPPTSQILYVMFVTHADDDGFVGNYKTLEKAQGATKSDIALLVAAKLIFLFEDVAAVVTDWPTFNKIRRDRYTPTSFSDLKATLGVTPQGRYTLAGDAPRLNPAWSPWDQAGQAQEGFGWEEKRKIARRTQKLPRKFEREVPAMFVGKTCPICGEVMTPKGSPHAPTILKSVPTSRGGELELGNVNIVCRKCKNTHSQKGTAPLNVDEVAAAWLEVSGEADAVRRLSETAEADARRRLSGTAEDGIIEADAFEEADAEPDVPDAEPTPECVIAGDGDVGADAEPTQGKIGRDFKKSRRQPDAHPTPADAHPTHDSVVAGQGYCVADAKPTPADAHPTQSRRQIADSASLTCDNVDPLSNKVLSTKKEDISVKRDVTDKLNKRYISRNTSSSPCVDSKNRRDDGDGDFHASVERIVSHLNDVTGRTGTSRAYKPRTVKTLDSIGARFEEGFTEADLVEVVDGKWAQVETGKCDPRWMSPKNLFGPNCESYLQEVRETAERALADEAGADRQRPGATGKMAALEVSSTTGLPYPQIIRCPLCGSIADHSDGRVYRCENAECENAECFPAKDGEIWSELYEANGDVGE